MNKLFALLIGFSLLFSEVASAELTSEEEAFLKKKLAIEMKRDERINKQKAYETLLESERLKHGEFVAEINKVWLPEIELLEAQEKSLGEA